MGKIAFFGFSDWRLAKGRRLGEDHTFSPKMEDSLDALARANNGRGADSVIVTPHRLAPVEFGLSLAGKGAAVHIFAPHPPNTSLDLDLHNFFFRELCLTTTYSTTHVEIPQVLDFLANGRIATDELITHRFGLHEMAEAIQLLERAGESLKIVTMPCLTEV
jgi:L-iditol 2-dehydrogenase